MKRSTLVRHLSEMAEEATSQLRSRDGEIGWPLEALWLDAELFDVTDEDAEPWIVLVIDAPDREVPWLAVDGPAERVGDLLDLGKRPFGWCYRPSRWPAWSHEHRRLVRFWSAEGGRDDAVLEALRTGNDDQVAVEEPDAEELRAQLGAEVVVSREHLRTVVEHYYDQGWRRAHRNGEGQQPDDHLWRAATAVVDIEDALTALEAGPGDGWTTG